jgi:hypothetical protein
MKKLGLIKGDIVQIRIIAIVVTIVSACRLSYGAPVGNIADPAMLKSAVIPRNEDRPVLSTTVGEETDLAFDRKVENYGYEGDSEYEFVGGKMSAVFFDKVTVYGIVGNARCKEYYEDMGITAQADSEPAIAWGVGGKVILYELPVKMEQIKDCVVRFGVDGRYRSTDFDIDRVAINGQWYYLPDTGVANVTMKLDEWQAAGEVSVQIGRFVPYCGIKYSDFNADVKVTVLGTTYDDDSIRPENKLGFFVGADIIMFESLSFNVEGRFIDETALSLGCTLRL